MKQETFNLFDAINREGIDNSVWGLGSDIKSTKEYFGTDEELAIPGQFVYVYHDKDDSFAFIDKVAMPSMTLHADGALVDIYNL